MKSKKTPQGLLRLPLRCAKKSNQKHPTKGMGSKCENEKQIAQQQICSNKWSQRNVYMGQISLSDSLCDERRIIQRINNDPENNSNQEQFKQFQPITVLRMRINNDSDNFNRGWFWEWESRMILKIPTNNDPKNSNQQRSWEFQPTTILRMRIKDKHVNSTQERSWEWDSITIMRIGINSEPENSNQ